MTRHSKAAALAQDMRNVVSEVEHLLRDVGHTGGGTVHQFKSRMGDVIDAARGRLDQLDTGMRDGTRYAVSATDELVHARPWQAIGVVALVGLVAGLLLARRY